MGMDSTDLFTLIRLAITAALLIDTNRGNDPAYNTPAKVHTKDFLLWTWGLGNGQVSKVHYTINLDNIALKEYQTNHHQNYISNNILPAPHNLPRQLKGLDPFIAGHPLGKFGIIFCNLAAGVPQVAEQNADTNRVVAEQNLCMLTMFKQNEKKNKIIKKELATAAKQMVFFCC